MAEVTLHVYDVTNSPSVKTNQAITQINRIMRDSMGIGGIFHGALEVFGEEWSFGFCEVGSGVFCCPPKQNPMYTYRESIPLGVTALDAARVRAVLTEISREWPGASYDLLARNCNHFCDELCVRLGAGHIPPWVNRFANAGDAALEAAIATAAQFRQLQNNVSSGARYAYRYMFGATNGSSVAAMDGGDAEGSALLGGGSHFRTGSSPLPLTSGSDLGGGNGGSDASRLRGDRSASPPQRTGSWKSANGGQGAAANTNNNLPKMHALPPVTSSMMET